MMKPKPTLGNMPWHIKQKIVGEANVVSQMNLRLCSREFLNLVSMAETRHHSLYFTSRGSSIEITLEYPGSGKRGMELEAYFGKNAGGYEFTRGDKRGFVEGGDYIHAAIAHFLKIFKKRKTSVRNLEFVFSEDDNPGEGETVLICTRLKNALKEFGQRLNVKRLHVRTQKNEKDILFVLPFLQPRELKSIVLRNGNTWTTPSLPIGAMADTEQWKHAKELRLDGFALGVPFEKWAHFRMTVINVDTMPGAVLKNVVMGFLRDPKWKETKIIYRNDSDRVINEFFREYEYAGDEETVRRLDSYGEHFVNARLQENKITLSRTKK